MELISVKRIFCTFLICLFAIENAYSSTCSEAFEPPVNNGIYAKLSYKGLDLGIIFGSHVIGHPGLVGAFIKKVEDKIILRFIGDDFIATELEQKLRETFRSNIVIAGAGEYKSQPIPGKNFSRLLSINDKTGAFEYIVGPNGVPVKVTKAVIDQYEIQVWTNFEDVREAILADAALMNSSAEIDFLKYLDYKDDPRMQSMSMTEFRHDFDNMQASIVSAIRLYKRMQTSINPSKIEILLITAITSFKKIETVISKYYEQKIEPELPMVEWNKLDPNLSNQTFLDFVKDLSILFKLELKFATRESPLNTESQELIVARYLFRRRIELGNEAIINFHNQFANLMESEQSRTYVRHGDINDQDVIYDLLGLIWIF
jgi:hypothetical protein